LEPAGTALNVNQKRRKNVENLPGRGAKVYTGGWYYGTAFFATRKAYSAFSICEVTCYNFSKLQM